MSANKLDYPVAAPDGIEPVIFRAMIIQSMALRYMKAVPSLTLDEAFDSALATWGTDWDEDPAPRSFAAAFDEVDGDLQHWVDD